MLKNYIYFNPNLDHTATEPDYKAECIQVMQEVPRKLLYYIDGIPAVDVCWHDLYACIRTAIKDKESHFTYYVFNRGDGKGEFKYVASVRIELKDLKLINPPIPHLDETNPVGFNLFKDKLKKQIPTIGHEMLEQISFFMSNSKMTYVQFAHEWNRQANDGDAFMIFRSKDNAYQGLSYKLVLCKADILNSI